MDRRRFLNLSAGTLPLLVGASGMAKVAHAGFQDRPPHPNERSPAELITPGTQRAIDQGLAFLSRRQIKAGADRGAFGTSGYAAGVATCGLGGLAFMCGGSAPADGLYGRNVDWCVEFILNNVQESGYISRPDNLVYENMYGHGFAMLFLAEAYGMTQKAEIGEKLRRAVRLTINAQNAQGGWRYQPVRSDADLSITVCQIMALRAARDAGIHVPEEVRAKCIDYVKRSQNPDGSFRYVLQGGHSTFAMTAAGVTSLYSAGIYDGDQVERALQYLSNHAPSSSTPHSHYFYGQYYAVQAMWHAGGTHWNNWYPAIRDDLLRQQSGDGSWNCPMAGSEFGTAVACIILQMPLNILPIFAP